MASDVASVFVLILFAVLGMYLAVWLYILLPAQMAANRGRSQVGWVIFSLVFSPVMACLLLWLLGENPND
jgi:hypothetical protein